MLDSSGLPAMMVYLVPLVVFSEAGEHRKLGEEGETKDIEPT